MGNINSTNAVNAEKHKLYQSHAEQGMLFLLDNKFNIF